MSMDVKALLAKNEAKDLLRISTAGSVDDGKSTLIGRLLYDSKTIYEDHLASLERDSVKHGTTGGAIDLALLLDGLKAEREQGITIDVAYRFFSTPRRKFIIADTPGHVQYTRNMATGASTANLAIILVDITRGITSQTKRHTFIASLLGIRHIVVAVNKMDLAGWERAPFERVRDEYTGFAAKLETRDIHFIPMSALTGANVVEPSADMPWYHGGPLLEYLENVHIASDENLIDFRFPVQRVARPDRTFRGFQGTVASGVARPGDAVMALPSGRVSRVKSIETFDGPVAEAFPPMAVTITLEDEIDISRGDMLVHVNNQPLASNKIEAMLVWMSDTPMRTGGKYLIKHTTSTAHCVISRCFYRVDVETLHRQDADTLAMNEIGRVQCALAKPLFHDPYSRNRATGAFILIDPIANSTLAAGMILPPKASALLPSAGARGGRGEQPLRPGAPLVPPSEKAARMGQRPLTAWLTGLPCSGKSTLAYAAERVLFDAGRSVCVLDSASLRRGVCADLGFSGDDRAENVRRAAALARMLNDQGLIAIVAIVSPFASGREEARRIIGSERFVEVHVDAPEAVRESRDAEGLYRRARDGGLPGFSGVTAPYEPPASPDLSIDTSQASVEECAARLAGLLEGRSRL